MCKYCNAAFYVRKNWMRHEKSCPSNPNRKMFVCDICGAELTRSDLLYRHKKRQRQGQWKWRRKGNEVGKRKVTKRWTLGKAATKRNTHKHLHKITPPTLLTTPSVDEVRSYYEQFKAARGSHPYKVGKVRSENIAYRYEIDERFEILTDQHIFSNSSEEIALQVELMLRDLLFEEVRQQLSRHSR